MMTTQEWLEKGRAALKARRDAEAKARADREAAEKAVRLDMWQRLINALPLILDGFNGFTNAAEPPDDFKCPSRLDDFGTYEYTLTVPGLAPILMTVVFAKGSWCELQKTRYHGEYDHSLFRVPNYHIDSSIDGENYVTGGQKGDCHTTDDFAEALALAEEEGQKRERLEEEAGLKNEARRVRVERVRQGIRPPSADEQLLQALRNFVSNNLPAEE